VLHGTAHGFCCVLVEDTVEGEWQCRVADDS
jgi:hypothetical protein